MKQIVAKNIRDLKKIQAIIKHIACQIVLRVRELLYQYFSHRLYAYFQANILQIVNNVVISHETQSNIPFSDRIGKSKIQKNVT